MHAAQSDRANMAVGENDTPAYIVGPYDPGLPGPMRLRLGLRPGTGNSPLGWNVEIASVELELGYNHVGIEERVAAGGIDWVGGLSMIEGLCGCCSQANTLAYVLAVETNGHIIVPARASYLRMVLVETERLTSHLLNAALTMQALNLPHEAVLRDLRERVLHAMSEWSGARIQPRLITYGGLSRNLDAEEARTLMLAMRQVERALRVQVNDIINSTGISARLAGLGVITAAEAKVGGLRGPVARAAGLATDVRVTVPSGAYEDEAVTVVAQRRGDAFSRLVVRLLECLESFRIVEQALDDLPPGPVKERTLVEMPGGIGIGRVEGPRGEVFCWVQGDADGPRHLHLSSGSFPSVGVIPGLLRGQDLEDLSLLLLSLDLCMACVER